MKLEKLALVSELVGAVAIVASLVVVAVEIRQNTVSQNAAIFQLMSEQVRGIALDVPNEIRLKIRNGEQLSELEALQYTQWFSGALRIYESWWKQNDLGVIDDETFESYISHLHISAGGEYERDYWLNDRLWSPLPGFEAYVNDYIERTPPIR
jgi:hypothetical protein